MLGVDLQERPEAVQAFARESGVAFPLAVDAEDRVQRLFGVRGYPTKVLIDRRGRMVGRILGERDWGSDAARELVRSLLDGRAPAAAPQARRPAPASPSRRMVHLVSAVRPDDPELTQLLDEASASLDADDELVILFDGQSVGALRMSASRQRTPLEEAEFTAPERQALARRLGVPYAEAPRNQLEYIQRLTRAGAKVFVNRSAIRLYGLSEDEIHPVAKPVSVRQMEKIVDESDECYSYGHR
jgi:PAS domain-containing protein